MAPRRSRRGNTEDKEKEPKRSEGEDEGVAEEEVTRCICGQADYPGPSPRIRELHPNLDTLPDEIGNFFVQCDKCSVWQHGGCMGFTDEDMLPELYYCEQCRPECHKVSSAANGTKYSRFLNVPAPTSSRSSSLSSNADQSKKKDSKSRANDITKKRATLNSRGAYDELEMLRRAIEESKEMGSLGKRGREESEDVKQNLKRQRTASSTPSAESARSQSPTQVQDESTSRSSTKVGASSKLRGAAARNNREKEIRDKQKEQAAAQRAEAASKRAARTERRRVEDSPPPPPTPSLSPSKMVQPLNSGTKSKADTPPLTKAYVNRKQGRTVARRGRLGRNQYTRDHLLNGEASDTSMRDVSQDPNGHNGSPQRTNGIQGESGRSSKAKTHPARTSMNEMKRRVAAILEFVGRMQSERRIHSSHQSSGSASSNGGANTPNGMGAKYTGGVESTSASSTRSHDPTLQANLLKAVEASLKEVTKHDSNGGSAMNHKIMDPIKFRDEREFVGMDSGHIMEILTTELVQWQSVYGAYNR